MSTPKNSKETGGTVDDEPTPPADRDSLREQSHRSAPAATVRLATAAHALGISEAAAHDLAGRGEFPCNVIPTRDGYRVSFAALLRVLRSGPGPGPNAARYAMTNSERDNAMPLQAGQGMSAPHRLVYSVEEAAALLGVGRTFMFNLIATGHIESFKIGTRRKIPRDAIDAYLESLRAK